MRLTILFLVALATFGKDKPAPPDPITDKLRFEIALAQRDFVAAQGLYNQALEKLRGKMAEAEKACEKANKRYSPETFECVAGPSTPPVGVQPEQEKNTEEKKKLSR